MLYVTSHVKKHVKSHIGSTQNAFDNFYSIPMQLLNLTHYPLQTVTLTSHVT